MKTMPATLEEMIEEKGWSLTEPPFGRMPPNGKRRTSKILKDVETRMNYTAEELEKEGGKNPGEVLKRILLVQSHLNNRMLANRNRYDGAYLSMMRHMAAWIPFAGGIYAAQLYRKNPLELVIEQRALTNELMEYFIHSMLEMEASFRDLGEQHTAAFRQVRHWQNAYKRRQKELSELLKMERTMAAETSKIDHVQLLYLNDKVLLEKQELQNRLNENAMNAKRAYNRSESLVEYLVTVNEAKQVLSNAYSRLEQVAAIEETAQTTVAAFMRGEKDLALASQVVEALSNNVVSAHGILKEVSNQLKSIAGKIVEKHAQSESASPDAKQLYATTHKMNIGAFEGVHEFMRKLDSSPSELLSGKRNGYHAEAAAELV